MDLNTLKPTERFVEIEHPKTGLPIGIKVSIVSINDDRMKRVKRKIQDERIRLESRGKGFKSEEIEDNRLILCFTAMTGWEWGKNPSTDEDVTFNGSKPEFNMKNVREVFSALPWFQTQVEEAISDEAAFF